jgi:exopolysaccharide biosynthesis polyprenyl glycosylphosphotransferase
MKRHFLRRRLRLGYLLAAGDGLLVLASLAASYAIAAALDARSVSPAEIGRKLAFVGVPLVAIQLGVLYVFGQHALPRRPLLWRPAAQLLLAVAAGSLISGAILFFTPHFVIGRLVVLMHVPLLSAALLAWRYALYHFAVAHDPPRRLAVAGSRRAVLDFISDLGRDEPSDYAVVKAHLTPSRVRLADAAFDGRGIDWCGDLEKLVGSYDYHALALDTREFAGDDELAERVIELSFAGIPVHDLATLHKDLTGCYPSGADARSIVGAIAWRIGPGSSYERAKRLLDVVLGSAALVACAVPMLVIGVLVRLESPGPAFFVQERVGRRRRSFRCIKFRTMVADAEAYSGPVWAEEEDPRITRVGSLLRKTRLDELPQLINVVRGEMTLVGPRPIRAFFADQLAKEIPFYDLRFAVKPGLTGWAQVHQRYARTMEEQEVKFRYDLFYLENISLWIDLYTLMKTLRVVLSGRE